MIEDVAARLGYSSWATIFRAISSPRMVSLAIDSNSSSCGAGSRTSKLAAESRLRLRKAAEGSIPTVRDNLKMLIGPWSERNDRRMKSRTTMPWFTSSEASDSSNATECAADCPAIEFSFLCNLDVMGLSLRDFFLTRRPDRDRSIFPIFFRRWLDREDSCNFKTELTHCVPVPEYGESLLFPVQNTATCLLPEQNWGVSLISMGVVPPYRYCLPKRKLAERTHE